MEAQLAILVSAFAAMAWLFVLGGIADHWRTRRQVPSGAMAACLVAAIGSVITLTITAQRFVRPELDLSWAGHIQRAMLLACGVVALVHLVRSRRRW